MLSPTVIIGCTYRVTSCDCASDTTLLHLSQWCDFCACDICNKEQIDKKYKHYTSDTNTNNSNNSIFTSLLSVKDVNKDILLLLCLVSTAIITIRYLSEINGYLYASGGIALGYWVREYAVEILKRIV